MRAFVILIKKLTPVNVYDKFAGNKAGKKNCFVACKWLGQLSIGRNSKNRITLFKQRWER